MTKRERVIAALRHENTDFVPYHIDFTQQALERLVEYTGDAKIEKKLGTHIYYKQYWGWPTELPDRQGYYKDDFGVVWNRTGADKDIGLPDEYQIEDIEENDYVFPVCDIARLRAECDEMMTARANGDDRFMMYGFGFLMFERAWAIAGMENVLMSMVACPNETAEFFKKIGDYCCNLLDIALEYDFDGIYFGDDWGQQNRLIMGYPHWKTYIKPQMARLYKKVKDKGLFVLQHSCGDCSELFNDLIEIGLDCYQTFQPEVYDIKAVKEQYGAKLAFWGGISTQQCLPYVTPDEVKKEIKRICEVLYDNGGYIIAPTHAIEFDVPPENIMAMVEVCQNQSKLL